MFRASKAAQQRRTPQLGSHFTSDFALAFWSAPVLRRFRFLRSIRRSEMPAISKNARVCETCGSPMETTSAGDLGCIACLMATGLDAEVEQSDTASDSAPEQLGPYTIELHADGSDWELGRGAMGVTYRAIDKALDRPVALKIININLGSRSAEARDRFLREARAAAALRHPNVATVYQFGVREKTGQFFYAMELVEGETLEERVRRLGPLDVPTTIDIALQVTAALEAAERAWPGASRLKAWQPDAGRA